MEPNMSIGDQNTERLLQTAYKPEPVPAEFAAALEKKMLEAAEKMASLPATPAVPPRRVPWIPILAVAMAACLLLVLGFLQWAPPNADDNRNVAGPIPEPAPELQLAHQSDTGMTPRQRPDGPAFTKLKLGETVTTQPGQYRLVQLDDGTRLFINEKSAVAASGAWRAYLAKGADLS